MSNMRFLAAMACALVCCACGETGITPANKGDQTAVKLPPPPPDPQPAPVVSSETFLIKYRFDFTGKMAASGTTEKVVSRDEYKRCEDYLIQEASGSSVGSDGTSALGFDNAAVQGGQVGFSVTLRIHGPGTYKLGPGDDGVVSDGTGGEGHIFSYGPEHGSGTITINRDGSVKIIFSGWRNPSDDSESGAVSWACK